MRSSLRRLAVPVAAAASLSLVGVACSSNTTTATTPGDTTAPGGGDFASLKGTVSGGGASFPSQFYEVAIEGAKEAAPDLTVRYTKSGSGQGKTDFGDQKLDFAGTDSLVKDEEKAKFKGGEFVYVPTVSAPVTVAYNVGVDGLKLSPATVAKIFSAQIKQWNDEAIKADNPGLTLPDKAITVVVRADSSGTTENFTKYLKAAGGDSWKLAASSTVEWPAGVTASQGNGGVANSIKGSDGSIGYVDFADAKTAGLKFAAVKNKDGQYVAPSLEGCESALSAAEVKDDGTYNALNAAGATSYPICASTYIIAWTRYPDAAKAQFIKGFLNYVLTDGQELAAEADYTKLPDSLKTKAQAQVAKIQG